MSTPLISPEKRAVETQDIEVAGLTAVFDGNTGAPCRTREVEAGHGAGRQRAEYPALGPPEGTPQAGVAGSNPAGGTSQKAPDRSWSGAFDIYF
ncbi:hypothetical protein GCM10010448_48890 [Streptomyces glomeratus]|uniref:Uncharacterized protein n=1 Tax=Streptomyces glomeratus TaxID=284452 RepID=A0ABP6LWK2_9ACTN